MSSEQKEWLSQASDNLSIDAQQLNELLSDVELQATWLRYQTAGAAMRQELPAQPDNQIADQFAAWLDQEPAHQLVVEAVQPVNTVVELSTVTLPTQTPAANQGWWKYVMLLIS